MAPSTLKLLQLLSSRFFKKSRDLKKKKNEPSEKKFKALPDAKSNCDDAVSNSEVQTTKAIYSTVCLL